MVFWLIAEEELNLCAYMDDTVMMLRVNEVEVADRDAGEGWQPRPMSQVGVAARDVGHGVLPAS